MSSLAILNARLSTLQRSSIARKTCWWRTAASPRLAPPFCPWVERIDAQGQWLLPGLIDLGANLGSAGNIPSEAKTALPGWFYSCLRSARCQSCA